MDTEILAANCLEHTLKESFNPLVVDKLIFKQIYELKLVEKLYENMRETESNQLKSGNEPAKT